MYLLAFCLSSVAFPHVTIHTQAHAPQLTADQKTTLIAMYVALCLKD